MNPELKKDVLLKAISRRKLEKQMEKMKAEMQGERMINIVKQDWLESVKQENQAIDKLMEAIGETNS